jgi:hypothetical protein
MKYDCGTLVEQQRQENQSSQKHLPPYQFVHNEPHTDCHGLNPGPPQWQASN